MLSRREVIIIRHHIDDLTVIKAIHPVTGLQAIREYQPQDRHEEDAAITFAIESLSEKVALYYS